MKDQSTNMIKNIEHMFNLVDSKLQAKDVAQLYFNIQFGLNKFAILPFENIHAFYQLNWVPSHLIHAIAYQKLSSERESHVKAQLIEDSHILTIESCIRKLGDFKALNSLEQALQFLNDLPFFPSFSSGMSMPYDGELFAKKIIEDLPPEYK